MKRTKELFGGWWICLLAMSMAWTVNHPRAAAQQLLPGTNSNGAQAPLIDATIDDAAMSDRVDELLEMQLRESGWPPADFCTDATFLRRVHLDLTGTPPSASEVVEFMRNSGADKRDRVIDRLLQSPASAVHLAETWAGWMLPEQDSPELQLGRQGLQGWLRDRFAENLRYDRLVSDLLVATGPPQRGPTAFFVSLEGKPEKIAAKTSRVFLGLQLDCAECHDHPFDTWKQRDFWGFAAYFSQMSVNTEAGMQNVGEVTDTGTGEVMLPGSETSVAPKPLVETGFSELASGTRRQQLALWLTARENPFVARAAVNRVWGLLFGRGLIEPIDDMRSLEMASHPQLLRELSDYFADSGYDLRRLLSLLAKTRVYARSAIHESGPPPDGSYATMPAKPLTEEQLTNCLAHVARQVLGEENAANQGALRRQLGTLRGDSSEAKLGIVSALVTLHGQAFDAVSRDESSRLLKALDAPYLDVRQQVRWLFLATLAREPSQAEEQAFSQLIPATGGSAQGSDGEGERSELRQWRSDLLWALINSTEFAMTP